MFDFDSKIEYLCNDLGIRYTRYADDLTFSTNKKNVLFQMPKIVRKLLSSHMSNLTINDSKTIFSSKAHNRHVTGVTITNEGTLSLGRKKKRYISSLIFKYSIGQISDEDFSHLRGMLGHAKYIEPDFISRVKLKYGVGLVNKIFLGETYE